MVIIKKRFTDLFTTIASSIPKLSLSRISILPHSASPRPRVSLPSRLCRPFPSWEGLGVGSSCLLALVTCLSSPSLAQVKEAEIVGNPTVNEDRVTVRVKVEKEDGKPVIGLLDNNFSLLVDGKEVEFKPRDWKSPEEATPAPAWIIVLLDFSGSMKQLDSRGVTKIEGAIKAIRKFSETLEERGGKTQVSIVPFGESGPNCEGYVVDKEKLAKFFPAGDFKLQSYLDYLETLQPCASTNLYDPLQEAVSFLGNTDNLNFYPPDDEKSQQPKPRLSIILLSDGYHTKPKEQEDFKSLKSLLRRNDQIIVHTLGYGLTPEELGAKYKLGRAATRRDLGEGEGKVPFEAFVDQQRLAEIAELTGGIAEFSGNDQKIAASLQLFLNALLGEYEITYSEPNPERGSKHKVQVVVAGEEDSVAQSQSVPYTIDVFGRSLPLNVRLTMFSVVLLTLGMGGVVPFYIWGQRLKEAAYDD
ncbi:MAG: VWA domain-containing protein [Symploca sp. SIO1A3]|nr:VWA domain-containing protein [Symploca sp. SIO1A3]